MRSTLLLALLALAPPAVADAPEWIQIRDEDGIVVERRPVAGSPLLEFRGKGRVEAPIVRIFSIIRDASRRAEWLGRCSEARALELQPLGQIMYQRTKSPWPAADRDTVLEAGVVYDSARREVRLPFHAVEHAGAPPVDGVVRMPFVEGEWVLQATDGGRATMVEFRVHADPGGWIPGWVANSVSKSLPWLTLTGLRTQAARASYPEFEAELLLRAEAKGLLETAP